MSEIQLCIYCVCRLCKERLMNVDWLMSMLLRASTLWSKVPMSALHCKTLNCPASLEALNHHYYFLWFFSVQRAGSHNITVFLVCQSNIFMAWYWGSKLQPLRSDMNMFRGICVNEIWLLGRVKGLPWERNLAWFCAFGTVLSEYCLEGTSWLTQEWASPLVLLKN